LVVRGLHGNGEGSGAGVAKGKAGHSFLPRGKLKELDEIVLEDQPLGTGQKPQTP